MGLMTISPPASDPVTIAAQDAKAMARAAAEDALNLAARHVAACALVEDISGLLGVDSGLVWQALSSVPDNMLMLLDSPQGWTALAGFVSGELGVDGADLMPAVH